MTRQYHALRTCVLKPLLGFDRVLWTCRANFDVAFIAAERRKSLAHRGSGGKVRQRPRAPAARHKSHEDFKCPQPALPAASGAGTLGRAASRTGSCSFLLTPEARRRPGSA